MKVYVVLHHYTDGSPATDTGILTVYATRTDAEAHVANLPRKDPGTQGDSWHEIEEWRVRDTGDE